MQNNIRSCEHLVNIIERRVKARTAYGMPELDGSAIYSPGPAKRSRTGESQGLAPINQQRPQPHYQAAEPMDVRMGGGSAHLKPVHPMGFQDGDKIVLKHDPSMGAIFMLEAGKFRCMSPCCRSAPMMRCFEPRLLMLHWGMIGVEHPESFIQRVP
jgi:hypothetical protein